MADEETQKILDLLARIEARAASLEKTLNEVSVAVAALTVGQRESRDTLHVIEAISSI